MKMVYSLFLVFVAVAAYGAEPNNYRCFGPNGTSFVAENLARQATTLRVRVGNSTVDLTQPRTQLNVVPTVAGRVVSITQDNRPVDGDLDIRSIIFPNVSVTPGTGRSDFSVLMFHHTVAARGGLITDSTLFLNNCTASLVAPN